jgi:FtsP/CotA-like multicopper oxidase with cupredoxin domain
MEAALGPGISRRTFIGSGAAFAGAAWFDRRADASGLSLQDAAPSSPITLDAEMRTLEINGKPASVMGLRRKGGDQGLSMQVNQPFNVTLQNNLAVPTAIHWHGLHPPNDQDGVPGLTQPVVNPGASALYNFPTLPSGTHWMHSHQGLQEAFLLSAPLIAHNPADEPKDEEQIILFFGDFSFTPPPEIYASLRKPSASAMAMSGKTAGGKMAMGKPDANDVDYDAYLVNDRTLGDPQVIRVENGARLRLRIINGSSGTNYFIDLGDLKGDLIATDGMPVQPVSGSLFPLAIAQRIDVKVQIPRDGAFPILGFREGASEQTGFILATQRASVKKLPIQRPTPSGLLTLDMERQFVATEQLAPKAIDRSFDLRLTGDMAQYEWSINGIVFDTKKPAGQPAQVNVKQGQRVALKFINETGMSHPMHLHGHSFQVIDINGQPLKGALRDTVLVTPKTSVTVVFDANNPGIWYVHCHVLWHLAAGMATLVKYET